MFLKEDKWKSSENFRCKENNCFSRRRSGEVQKFFAAKRIIVSQGEEVEKFRKFFAAKRIIVSQREDKWKSSKNFRYKENNCFGRKISGKVQKTFTAKRIIVSQGR